MHTNFATIDNNIANEMVDAGIAEELVELKYADAFGYTAENKDSFCNKITYEIKYPDYYLVADELISNIS